MISILVVDHDHAGRATTRTHLERAGYDVITAKSHQEAMLVAKHRRPLLIVSKEPDGLELCRLLREDSSIGELPVVLVSERPLSERDRERALQLGALEWIESSADFKRELTWIRVAVQQVRGAS